MTDAAAQSMIFDFTESQTAGSWKSIDDRIMGGCSTSRAEHVDGVGMRFHGRVSLDNDGGFASIRSQDRHFDLGGLEGVTLRLRGDGRRYKLSLRTDRYFDGISYQADFDTTAGAWTEVFLPFSAFVATHHGITLTTAAPLQPEHIQSFGLFIADRQAGPFCLDITWIR